MAEIVLSVKNLTKKFPSGSGDTMLTVVDDVSFELEQGSSLSISGPSGSGKTTLIGLCAGLDTFSEGYISLAGFSLNPMNEDERAGLRNRYIGFVFQNFQLMQTLTALENVMLPLELRGEKKSMDKAQSLLDRVGLGDRLKHYPAQLSGGEQQRVSLARAFINTPKILFADEPTGNLDEDNARRITDLLFAMNKEQKTTLVLVTHSLELAKKTKVSTHMRGGKMTALSSPMKTTSPQE